MKYRHPFGLGGLSHEGLILSSPADVKMPADVKKEHEAFMLLRVKGIYSNTLQLPSSSDETWSGVTAKSRVPLGVTGVRHPCAARICFGICQ